MPSRRWLLVAAGVLVVCLAGLVWQLGRLPGISGTTDRWADVPLNQVQVVGTHNSYHQRLTAQERRYARLAGPAENRLEYAYPSIGQQLRDGARVLELDLYPDPAGGLYARPLIRRLAGLGPLPGLTQPGTKVLHIADADYRSSCPTLSGCLAELAGFSRDQPHHSPVFVMVEFKSTEPRLERLGGARSGPWDAAALATVDAEISAALGGGVITPDEVRRPGRTLEQSVLAGAWPTIGQARGATVFAMLNPPGPVRDAYLAGHRDLSGRQMFTDAEPGQPDAAILKRDDPGAADIPGLVARGYLVRTRADGSDLALARASGAQLISTDTAGPVATVLRCDPVSAGAACPVEPPRSDRK